MPIWYFESRAAARDMQAQIIDEPTYVMEERPKAGPCRFYLIHQAFGRDFSTVYLLRDGTFGACTSAEPPS